MKDRLRNSRYNPHAKMPFSIWKIGKRKKKSLKKFWKSNNIPMLGEALFKNNKDLSLNFLDKP